MKKIAFMFLMLAAISLQAQKQPKPNLNKVLSMLQEGKLAEAKDMADAATTYEKTKDDGKTWYYRGLVYATIDTTAGNPVKESVNDPFGIAMKSFAKADSIDSNNEFFVSSSAGIFTKSQQMEMLANHYLNTALKQYQEEPIASLENMDKTKKIAETQLKTYANDTLTYYVGALVANEQEQWDRAIEDATKYIEKGGTSRDMYLILYQIYSREESKMDSVKALEIVRAAKKKFTSDATFPRIEIEMLVQQNKVEEAKANLKEQLNREPNDKQLHYFLGYINTTLKLHEEARENFVAALKVDPTYFDAQYALANTYLIDVDKLTKEWSAVGSSQAESKKRSELIQKRVKAAETAIPYLEKAEQMKAPDSDTQIEVLEKLKLLYYYTADDKNTARVAQKLKALGADE
ncbi:MAG TPA: tetratricopeptide repeat protein [Chryseosolibacter sp.]|nr:tetratricopeptide repeat protein [Chryseosolibacter sp.]